MNAFNGVIVGIVGGALLLAIIVLAVIFRRSERVQIKVEIQHSKGDSDESHNDGGDPPRVDR